MQYNSFTLSITNKLQRVCLQETVLISVVKDHSGTLWLSTELIESGARLDASLGGFSRERENFVARVDVGCAEDLKEVVLVVLRKEAVRLRTEGIWESYGRWV